ncbi:hemerythrin domain-containing protein [Nocardia spumae]|uniref:hemerythrin domain-containing protein n=1 Tax=Nocardia spumae TaxID=2887190 RepID=UPI001D14A288|nr:hemerythrin domain-containing protein [Nocardia spumae]
MEKPDVTMMILVHDAFRRDVRRLRAVAGQAAGDPAVFDALCAGWDTFRRYLIVHHTAEDDVLWPVLRAELADRPDRGPLLDAMVDEHAQLDPIMAEIDAALSQRSVADLVARFDALGRVLVFHLDHEEVEVLPLVRDTLTPSEWKVFGDDQRRRVGLRGGSRFFPWLLDGASPEGVAHALALLPPPLRLVYRFVWRPRYERRSPWPWQFLSPSGAG